MKVHCTRPGCPRPQNDSRDLDNRSTLKTTEQKYCTACGMSLILGGRYLPTQLLAQGGFGTAFLACDRYTPALQQCVVKQFQPSANLSADDLLKAKDLFEREAEVLEELGKQHPQIPTLLASFSMAVPSLTPGKQEEFFYLVQEYIDGQTLEEELETQGKFSEAQVREVLNEILKILEFVHHCGAIHRDIKPANLMRHRNGKLYLLDFGAVKQVTTAGMATTKSTGIYSLGFAPPEQMAGGQVYPATDLYALAVTVISLLTGKPPQDLFDTYNNQWNWRSYAQTSDRLEAILNRMLQHSPSQRFASAAEVLAELDSGSAVVSSTASPPTTVQSPPPVQSSSIRRSFSTLELLAEAAFTGIEGGLVGVALASLLGISGLSAILWGMVVGGLVFVQSRRWIEGKDLPIITGITLATVVLIPALRAYPVAMVLMIIAFSGLSAIAVTALFRLVYRLLSRFL
ncbi:MAG: serine/threonine-protein kinase [Geitlerinemataceae cyanobacterium]